MTSSASDLKSPQINNNISVKAAINNLEVKTLELIKLIEEMLSSGYQTVSAEIYCFQYHHNFDVLKLINIIEQSIGKNISSDLLDKFYSCIVSLGMINKYIVSREHANDVKYVPCRYYSDDNTFLNLKKIQNYEELNLTLLSWIKKNIESTTNFRNKEILGGYLQTHIVIKKISIAINNIEISNFTSYINWFNLFYQKYNLEKKIQILLDVSPNNSESLDWKSNFEHDMLPFRNQPEDKQRQGLILSFTKAINTLRKQIDFMIKSAVPDAEQSLLHAMTEMARGLESARVKAIEELQHIELPNNLKQSVSVETPSTAPTASVMVPNVSLTNSLVILFKPNNPPTKNIETKPTATVESILKEKTNKKD